MTTLDPRLANWLDGYNQLVSELDQQGFQHTPQTMREGFARLNANLVKQRPELASIEDIVVSDGTHNVPVRVYHPAPDQQLPVLIYLHGGGHMCGSVDVYDPICRQLALATSHVVVSVEYRLAPEYPYPHGLEDAALVIENIERFLDPGNTTIEKGLALAGDSGGGAMASTLAHQYQSQQLINKLVLIYPGLDYDMQHDSVQANGEGYLLHTDRIAWYFDHYLQGNEDRQAVSPLAMAMSETYPHTLLVTAEFCPLRDEAYAYRDRLLASGVSCDHLHYDDLIHAFLNLQDLVPERCKHFYDQVSKFLNENSD